MRERTRCLLLAITLTAAVLAAPAAADAQAPAACPATFEVLHDDTVGALYLPKGNYTISLLDPAALSCAEASDLFRQFLEDFDGRLSRPWVVDPRAAAFTRGAGGSVGFTVSPAGSGGGGGGGGHHPGGHDLPGHLPGPPRRSHRQLRRAERPLPDHAAVGRQDHCSRAAAYLARFLDDYDGILPRPWFLDPETGSFMRGAATSASASRSWPARRCPHGGGSGTYPSGRRCPGTFRVLNNDSIGRLRLRKGSYSDNAGKPGAVLPARDAALPKLPSGLRRHAARAPGGWRCRPPLSPAERSRSAGFRVKPTR